MKSPVKIHFPLFAEVLLGHLYSGHPCSLSPLSLAGEVVMPLCKRGSPLNTEMGDASHLR